MSPPRSKSTSIRRSCTSSGFTLTDVINAIANNNVRAPGGIVYEPNRETNLDIRGDMQDVPTRSQICCSAIRRRLRAASSSASSVYPWTATSRLYRIVGRRQRARRLRNAARLRIYQRDSRPIELDVQKAAGASEVTASNAVLAAAAALRAQYPDINFSVLNVQSTYTKELLSGVTRTLIEGIIFTAIVMLFFLRSWRKAVVVMIAVPASFLVTLAAMQSRRLHARHRLAARHDADDRHPGRRLDRRARKHLERHQEEGEQPQRRGDQWHLREIGVATIVITLVIVVVFVPLSFLPGSVGLFLREFGLVVTVATLTSLFVSFAVTPALAGRWALFSQVEAVARSSIASPAGSTACAAGTRSARCRGVSNNRALVVWVSFVSLVARAVAHSAGHRRL